MTNEFPPPDPRLAGKVKIVKLEPNTRLRRGNGNHGVMPSHDARPDVESGSADGEIGQLDRLAPLEYERQRKGAAERLIFAPPPLIVWSRRLVPNPVMTASRAAR